jgi:hypothetical protein
MIRSAAVPNVGEHIRIAADREKPMERVRLARIVRRLAGRLMTVAENLTPPDLRRRPSITHDRMRRSCARASRRSFFKQANGCTT